MIRKSGYVKTNLWFWRLKPTGILLAIILFLAGCVKDFSPSDAITTEVLTSSTAGLTNAVNGAYALFKDHVSFNGTQDDNNMYLRQYFQLSDFASDDIVCGQVTEDPLFYSFSLNHSPTQPNVRYFWYISYKIINDCNTVIEANSAAGIEQKGVKKVQAVGSIADSHKPDGRAEP